MGQRPPQYSLWCTRGDRGPRWWREVRRNRSRAGGSDHPDLGERREGGRRAASTALSSVAHSSAQEWSSDGGVVRFENKTFGSHFAMHAFGAWVMSMREAMGWSIEEVFKNLQRAAVVAVLTGNAGTTLRIPCVDRSVFEFAARAAGALAP